jgi:hypothetical protein
VTGNEREKVGWWQAKLGYRILLGCAGRARWLGRWPAAARAKRKKERRGETGLSQKKRERRSGRLRREKERRERFRVFLRL